MGSYSIGAVESIGAFYAAKLKAAGIRSTARLLDRATTPKARRQLAEAACIPESDILRWANLCDLMRVHGVAASYAELLEAAGVDTVKALARRNAANLLATMTKINNEKRIVQLLPATKVVARWIDEAKTLEPKISYRGA